MIPSWSNSTGASPYSFSNAQRAPLVSADNHSASRALTTNHPSVTGVSPEPEFSRRASCIAALCATGRAECAVHRRARRHIAPCGRCSAHVEPSDGGRVAGGAPVRRGRRRDVPRGAAVRRGRAPRAYRRGHCGRATCVVRARRPGRVRLRPEVHRRMLEQHPVGRGTALRRSWRRDRRHRRLRRRASDERKRGTIEGSA